MNYYDILEISKNASDEVIKNAYRALAKKYHPDTANSNSDEIEEKMRKINEAYEVLSNKEKRALYDEDLKRQELENMQDSSLSSDEVHLTSNINSESEEYGTKKAPKTEEEKKKELRKKIIIIAIITFFSVALISFLIVSAFVEPQKSEEEQNKQTTEEKEEEETEEIKDKENTNNSYESEYEVKNYNDDKIVEHNVNENTNTNENDNNIDDGIIKIY